MRRGCRLAVALVAALALCASAPGAGAAPDWASLQIQPYEPPQPAPAFALPDLDGTPVALEDFRGRVVVLVFWTTW